MTSRFRKLLAASTIILLCDGAWAHQAVDLKALEELYGVDFTTMPVDVQELKPGRYGLFAFPGSNMIVSIGEDGVLLIDSHFPEMAPKIKQAIRDANGSEVEFLVNTHWHFDHVDGNGAFVDDGAVVIAHDNTRSLMLGRHTSTFGPYLYTDEPTPKKDLPVLTLKQSMQLHFNDEPIDLWYFGKAHTTGDIVAYFRDADIVHMGDLYDTQDYPLIDLQTGGSINGMIAANKAVLEKLNDDTIVMPGHGPVSNVAELKRFVRMMETVRDRVQAMIDKGMNVDQVVAAKPTADLDEEFGNPATFVTTVFDSLIRD